MTLLVESRNDNGYQQTENWVRILAPTEHSTAIYAIPSKTRRCRSKVGQKGSSNLFLGIRVPSNGVPRVAEGMG